MQTIITDVFEPSTQIQTEEGLRDYLARLAKLSRLEICSELSNVLSAKHNQMMVPTGVQEYEKKQNLVTDLTDKATWITLFVFGHETVSKYTGSDLTRLNELINELDEQVAQQNLDSEQHGASLLGKLDKVLSSSRC